MRISLVSAEEINALMPHARLRVLVRSVWSLWQNGFMPAYTSEEAKRERLVRTHRGQSPITPHEIAEMFRPGAKVTILIRNPSLADGDMLISDDDLGVQCASRWIGFRPRRSGSYRSRMCLEWRLMWRVADDPN